MGHFNYQKAKEFYMDDSFMLEIINRLEEMNQYHLLRNYDYLFEVMNAIPASAMDYDKWLSVCNGGLLFSTTLLSRTEYDEQLDLSFSTLQEWNTDQKHKLLNLPRGYFIIALLNYGDPICLSESDSKVYLWDTTEEEFTTIWDSFADFLADEYNTAVQMLEDNVLESIPIKASGGQYGQ